MSRNDNSTANRDVVAKGAVIKFFKSLPWYEKIRNRELKKRNIRGPPNLGDVPSTLPKWSGIQPGISHEGLHRADREE